MSGARPASVPLAIGGLFLGVSGSWHQVRNNRTCVSNDHDTAWQNRRLMKDTRRADEYHICNRSKLHNHRCSGFRSARRGKAPLLYGGSASQCAPRPPRSRPPPTPRPPAIPTRSGSSFQLAVASWRPQQERATTSPAIAAVSKTQPRQLKSRFQLPQAIQQYVLSWAKQARTSSGKSSMTTDTLLRHGLQHLQQAIESSGANRATVEPVRPPETNPIPAIKEAT